MFSNLFIQLIMSWMNWVHYTTNWTNSYDLCIAQPASEHWCPPSQEHRHASLSSGIHLWTRPDTLLEEPCLPASSLSRETQTHLYPKSKSNPIMGVCHCTQHRTSTNHIVTYWAVMSSPMRYSPVSLCFQSHSRSSCLYLKKDIQWRQVEHNF